MNKLTAIAYVRVSTEQQSQEGVSLEAQKAKLAAWCLANDAELEAVYVDAGISGKRADNRPELQAALEHVTKARGVLVVYSLSRLARSTKDTITIGERLAKSGADLVSLSEKLDTTTAAGKMVFRMLAVLSEFERDQVSERTAAALQHKRRQGERVGTVPFGKSLEADGITLVDNEQERQVLETIAELRAAGESMRAIAAELTRRQVPTKGGKKKWTHSTVQRILNRAA